jgi:LysM repeat protein
MESHIAELERHYQVLFSQYQSGAIDEATFIAEVDKLQIQDNYGRYWMIGAQSGAWHYFDGQTWHQAEPRDADKLPFMDEQGRYWQRGAKSGDWYYYQPDTNEWVKPDQSEPVLPVTDHYASAPAYQYGAAAAEQPYTASQPAQPGQTDTELFQDDEGRYWSVGSKTGLWYFYDADGWHPAEEFERRTGKVQPPPPAPAPAYTAPPAQPQQPVVNPAAYAPPSVYQQPAQPPVATQPQAGTADEAVTAQAATASSPQQQPQPQPAPATVNPQTAPPPPNAATQSGTWFYFDGKQWLQYSTGEPAADTPPDPKLILEQEPQAPKEKARVEPITAEYIAEDDPPVEVVDVEVITVVEPEPPAEPATAPISQPNPVVPVRQSAPQPDSPSVSAGAALAAAAAASIAGAAAGSARTAGADSETTGRSTSQLSADEIIPRREKSNTDLLASGPRQATSPEQEVTAKRHTPTGSDRPVTPRKRTRSAAHEPTIIIPTGATTTPARGVNRPSSRPTAPVQPQQRRRARENTLPMEPVKVSRPSPTPQERTSHRQVTQAMPVVSRTPQETAATPAAAKSQPSQPPKQATKPETGQPAPAKPAQKKDLEQEKSGYTLGEILRAFPSTVWTGIAGVAVLLIFAVLIILGFVYGGNLFGASSVAAVQNPTPTLSAGPPDTTPTPGPTPTENSEAGPVATPTKVALTTYSSIDLDFTLEYPENWETSEDGTQLILSPSTAGLSPDTMEDVSMRIGRSDNNSISDLLTEMLTLFPENAESLNEGTLSIGAQTWTSTQIRYDDEELGEPSIATLAVTSRDGNGYALIAVAPAAEWNSAQPVFQSMINSFRFGIEEVSATSTTTPRATRASDNSEDETSIQATTPEVDAEGPDSTATPKATATKKPTPTPEAAATPLVYAVGSGDTLLEIANKFGVDVDLLVEENGLDEDQLLQIGQEITIPFTAEELAAYNANQSGTQTSTGSNEEEAAGDEAAVDEAAAGTTPVAGSETATAPPESAPEEEEAATDAAPVSGRIVYPAFNVGSGVYDVWMADLTTGEQTPIAGAASQPAFNKDGSLLAYRSWERDTRGIFFRDFIGGRGDIVTRFVEDALPTWSPDGFSFAFSSRKEGDRVPRVYVGNQMGEEPFSVGFQGEYPSTMPDGRLLVKGCTPSGDCGMFLMGSRGGATKKISDDASDTAPAPSPDGSKIAFMSFNRGGNNWEVWVMNADGSNMSRLTENNNADGLPAWSPDGQSIAFVSDRGGVWAVWVMNTDGSNQRKLFDMQGSPDGTVLHDESNSRGWLEERISWAP